MNEGMSEPRPSEEASTAPSTGRRASTEGIVLEPMEIDNMIESLEEDANMVLGPDGKPKFSAQKGPDMKKLKTQVRRVTVPKHRMSPLKANWMEIVSPLVEKMKLQVRMNLRKKAIEIRMSNACEEVAYLQKAADFCKAFMLGFDVQDSIALLRLDDLFIQSFEVKDVKRLQGDHLARCIGRLAGKDGKTKFAIENTTRTRIVIADTKIHILGSFSNIRLARDSICSLILGSVPSKVYNRLKTVSRRLQERI